MKHDNRNESQHQHQRHVMEQRLLLPPVRWWWPMAQQRRPASIASGSQLTLFLLDDGAQFFDGHIVTLFDGGLDDLFDVRIERHRGYSIGDVIRANGL